MTRKEPEVPLDLSIGDVRKLIARYYWHKTKVSLPYVRRVHPGMYASQITAVQPMTTPKELVFFLDAYYGTNLSGSKETDD